MGTVTSPPTLKDHFPSIAAATVATLTASVLLSFLGTAGTVAGTLTASLITGTAAVLYERWLRSSAYIVRKWRANGNLSLPEKLSGAFSYTMVRMRERDVPWRTLGIVSGVTLALGAGAVTAVEASAGKPLSSVVRGQAGHGLSFGSSSTTPSSPAPSVTPSTVVTPSATTQSPSMLPSSPATTPAQASSSAAPSITPSVPASTTPAPVPPPSVPASTPASTAPATPPPAAPVPSAVTS